MLLISGLFLRVPEGCWGWAEAVVAPPRRVAEGGTAREAWSDSAPMWWGRSGGRREGS